MQRLPSLNWHKLTEIKQSSHLETLEGFHRRLKATDMSRQSNGRGGLPKSLAGNWLVTQANGEITLILTKPLQGRMKCLRNHVRHLVRASLTINRGRGRRTGVESPRYIYCTWGMSNRYSKLAMGLPTHLPSPPVRKAESCAKQVEYKWTLKPQTNWIDKTGRQ